MIKQQNLTIMNKKPVFTCPHCAREYKRKTFYDKHVLLCKILITKNDDDTVTMGIKELYELISEIALRQTKVEEQVSTLTKWVNTKRKKLSIINWLNENAKANITYSEWKDKLQINKKHLETIFQYDYIEGISNIIKENLLLQEEEILCFKAFDQKENALFVYTEEGWILLSPENFESLLVLIDKLLMKEFVIWQDELKKTSKNDYFELFAENVQKVMGGHFTREQILSRVKKNIFKHLKMNLRNIIQFEFS